MMYIPIHITRCERGMTHLRTCINGTVNHVSIRQEANGRYSARWTVDNHEFRLSNHSSRGDAIDFYSESLLAIIRSIGYPLLNRDD